MIIVELDDNGISELVEYSRIYHTTLDRYLTVTDKKDQYIIEPETLEVLRENNIIFTIIKIG